jgi:hypothetical protein
MSKTNDYSRRLFADFIAARLKARLTKKDEPVQPSHKAAAREEEVTDRSPGHDAPRGNAKRS